MVERNKWRPAHLRLPPFLSPLVAFFYLRRRESRSARIRLAVARKHEIVSVGRVVTGRIRIQRGRNRVPLSESKGMANLVCQIVPPFCTALATSEPADCHRSN